MPFVPAAGYTVADQRRDEQAGHVRRREESRARLHARLPKGAADAGDDRQPEAAARAQGRTAVILPWVESNRIQRSVIISSVYELSSIGLEPPHHCLQQCQHPAPRVLSDRHPTHFR
eukprot:2709131-Rhodomonas_salina.1